MAGSQDVLQGHEACFDGLFRAGRRRPCATCAAAYERVEAELGPPPFPVLAWLRQGFTKEGWLHRGVRHVANGLLGR